MKFGEYVQNLQDLLRDRPELIDSEVISSIDDEGNGYNNINWGPTPGYYDNDSDEFISEDDIRDDYSDLPLNVILIN